MANIAVIACANIDIIEMFDMTAINFKNVRRPKIIHTNLKDLVAAAFPEIQIQV